MYETYSHTSPHALVLARLPVPAATFARNLILLIGDGMGVSHLSSAWVANRGKLNIQLCPHVGLMSTYSASEFITDSAAAATAIATGHKTHNEALGVDIHDQPLLNIREILAETGYRTGLLSACAITEATPAAFVSHQSTRFAHEDIALDYIFSEVDFFLGSGLEFFSDRTDGLNLLSALRQKGYQVVHEVGSLAGIEAGRVAGLLGHTPAVHEGRTDWLVQASKHALRLLSDTDQGFFFMVEGSQIDWGAHDNDTSYVVQELLEFDEVVGQALAFAAQDGETLVVVASDHETGGMALHDGNLSQGRVEGAFSTTMHTGAMVPIFAYGPGAHVFQGIYDNCDLFYKMLEALNIVISSSQAVPAS